MSCWLVKNPNPPGNGNKVGRNFELLNELQKRMYVRKMMERMCKANKKGIESKKKTGKIWRCDCALANRRSKVVLQWKGNVDCCLSRSRRAP
jgi:hypothetical protein